MKKRKAKSGKALASKATNHKKQNQCSLFARLTTYFNRPLEPVVKEIEQ